MAVKLVALDTSIRYKVSTDRSSNKPHNKIAIPIYSHCPFQHTFAQRRICVKSVNFVRKSFGLGQLFLASV